MYICQLITDLTLGTRLVIPADYLADYLANTFINSVKISCDLFVRSWVKHMDKVGKSTFLTCWQIDGDIAEQATESYYVTILCLTKYEIVSYPSAVELNSGCCCTC